MKYLYTLNLLFFSLIFQTIGMAQYSHQDILIGQSGSSLKTNLRLNYRPSSLPTYAQARDNMFKQVYKENDTVTCVYTGLKRYLPPLADPSTAMYDNASSVSIDTEHSYPQSKTTNDAGKADLHHMFPTRAMANNGRGSIPFGEISTNNIDKWYYNDQTLSSAPAAPLVDLSSKQHNNVMFEPREDHKGNVARAMFYYYTMYESEANAADPNYFNNQKAKLCEWHLADPVDSLEWLRTSRISLYQQQKVNPFVMDCTLPQRCGYCTTTCSPPNAVSKEEAMGLEIYPAYPNPFAEQTIISYQLHREQQVILELYNNVGQKVKTLFKGEQTVGAHQFSLEAADLANGIYFYTLNVENQGQSATFARPIVLNR